MKEILTRLFNHETLSSRETREILLNITHEAYPESQIAAMLAVFQMRGVTVDELLGLREALMSTCVAVDLHEYHPIDIVGTGGDNKNTFNISTCACFVVAGAGYHVAKHGNYGATSVSGASNVMELHGVKFTNDIDQLRRSMDTCGMVYMHAPLFNPAMKYVAPVRKSLQIRTIFNLIGPLVNPCSPAYQLLGVANLEQMRLYTNIFQRLGVGFAIVNSLDGYDEISLTDHFKVVTDRFEQVFHPHDFGFKLFQQTELSGGQTPQDASRIFDDVLLCRATPAQTECVLINAAFSIQIMEPNKNIDECIAIARESLESSRAFNTFRRFLTVNS